MCEMSIATCNTIFSYGWVALGTKLRTCNSPFATCIVLSRQVARKIASCNIALKGHCHEHNFKNSAAQKHVYTTGNLLTVVKLS